MPSRSRFLSLILATFVIGALLLTACTGPSPTPPPSTAPSPGTPTTPAPPAKFEWPKTFFISAVGTSGNAKMVSWASVLESTTGMTVRVVPDSQNIDTLTKVKKGETSLTGIDRNELRNNLEALEDWAVKDAGPWPVRIAWVHDLAHAGFIVRGDSPIKYPSDIKPGTRFAVFNMNASTLNPSRGLIAWAGLKESDIVWFDAGSTDGAVRAIPDGRADIAFIHVTSPILIEAAASPKGIRFISLDASKEPEGAKRFQQLNPLYAFGPISSGTLKESIGTWATSGYMHDIANASLSTDLVYNLAKWFDENYDKIKDKYASNQYMNMDYLMDSLKTTYIPVHDGLIKYLKEKGKWTPAHDARQKVNLDLLQKYIDAYPKAIAQAEQKGIKVDPTNYDWIKFWTQYKIDNKVPKFVMHPTLEQNGPVIMVTEVPPPPKAPTPLPATPGTQGTASDVKFEFKSVTNPAKQGKAIVVVGKTEPGAECTIAMTYVNGQKSSVTFPKPTVTADATGNVQWDGALNINAYVGKTKLDVTVVAGGKTATFTTYYEIAPA